MMIHRWLVLVPIVLGGLVAGCAGDDDIGDGRAGAEIKIESFDFGSPLVVEAGAVVGVVNADGVGHTRTSVDDVFDSGFLEPGDDFEFRFAEPGEFGFFCSIHTSMTGSITVES